MSDTKVCAETSKYRECWNTEDASSLLLPMGNYVVRMMKKKDEKNNFDQENNLETTIKNNKIAVVVSNIHVPVARQLTHIGMSQKLP